MVNLESIEAAAARISASIYESPLMHSKMLSRLTGNSVFLKLENLQMTGAFKERGALNRILTLTEEERRGGWGCVRFAWCSAEAQVRRCFNLSIRKSRIFVFAER